MLLQTNSYIVPRDKRVEHARLLRRFRQTLLRLGCDHFEVYEQTGANWSSGDNSGRFVQIMRFRDRKQQLAVQSAERSDPAAQALLKEFCELINLPYQQQQGLFAAGFYTSFMRMPEARPRLADGTDLATQDAADQNGGGAADGDSLMAVAEPLGADNGEPQSDSNNGAEPETGANTAPAVDEETNPDAGAEAQSNFGTDEDSDYSEPGHIPGEASERAHGESEADITAVPPETDENAENQDEQAENPTFPSNS